jgi:hypothetical protein
MVIEKESEAADGPSHSAYLLRRIAEEAQRAQDLDDPREQAKVIATLIQPYAGWALREAVLDCRDAGAKWSEIASEVGLSQAVLSRQARGIGPVVTIAPSYDRADRNADAQTPLRLAATTVVHSTMALGMAHPDTPTVKHLYIPVMAMAQAQTANQAEPLLHTVRQVLHTADQVAKAHHDLGATTPGEHERAVWAALDELRTAHQRDHGAIRVAAELNALPKGQGKR